MPTPVTDPNILQQLNNGSNVPVPVTDPNILSQLNAEKQPPTILDKLAETWPARLAKDIYSSAKLPGDVYSGVTQVDPSNPEFMSRVTTLGGMAPVGTLPSVMSAAPSAKQLVGTGGNLIQQAEDSGLTFTGKGASAGIQDIRSQIPRPERAPDTHEALNNLAKKAEIGDNITIKDILNTRGELRDVQSDAAKGRLRTSESELRAATIAKKLLDDFGNAPPESVVSGDPKLVARLLSEGNQNVSAGKLAETLDRKQYVSELKAATANSGQNLENTIRRNIANLIIKEGRTMSPEVRDAAEQVAFGTNLENSMRSWGNTLGGGGGLGRAITMGGAGALAYMGTGGNPTLTGIAAGAFPVAGSLLKHGATTAAINHLDALSNMLRSNTPLGKTITRGNYFSGVEPSIPAAKAALIRSLLQQSPYPPTNQ